MSDDRWSQVEELYHDALEVLPERRAAFLGDRAGDDSELLAEVASLLAQHQDKDTVFDQPAWTDSGSNDEPASRKEALLASGAILGPYRIIGLLGAGGMGQVYRAHDSRLDRSVAIKVMFPGQDVRRFQKEARAVAALSHPNVVPIFDVGHHNGVDYLVEELVEGESLREVLRRGPLEVARCRHLAAQIAEGLAAAHRAGIVHRDLKPGNIMVSREDCARILDFGLATSYRAGSNEAISVSQHGVFAGTAAYMSPEQVLGGGVDSRSDIFSYGATLYEMATGRQAFAGNTIPGKLTAVLEADPPPAGEIVPGLPLKLSQIIQRCLSKDQGSRFQAIDDVRLALDDLQKDTNPAVPVRPSPTEDTLRFDVFEVNLATAELRKRGVKLRLQEQPFQVLAALLERPGEVVTREDLIRRLWADGTVVDFDRGLIAAVTRLRQALSDSAGVPRYVETVARRGYRFIGAVESARDEVRPAPLPMPSPRTGTWAAATLIFAIALGITLFWGWWSLTHAHATRSETPLNVVPLTTGAGVERNPSFSPDGSQIVYEWAKEDGQRHLYIKVVGSGDPVPLTSGDAADYGPAWSPDGRLIAFLRQLDPSTMGVFVIPPLGGVERKVTEIAPPQSDSILRQFHRRLDWARDNRHLIVSAPAHTGGVERLLLVSVENGEKTWLTEPSRDSKMGDRDPAVSPDDRTVAFVRGELGSNEGIHLLPLSSDLRPAGAPRPLASTGRARNPAWTADGKRIVYTDLSPGMTFGSGAWIIGMDPGDVPHPLPALGRNAALPAVARTGRLAYSRQILQSNIWRQEIPARAGAILQPVRLTASSAGDYNAQYSPDGGRIAFSSNRSGSREIWTCASDGAQSVQVTAFNGPFVTGSPHWSPDGRQIVFDSAAAGQIDVYVVDANGGSPRRLTDATHGRIPSWSHDGRWIYFSARMTGRNEIWKIPSAGGKSVQVTRNGGFIGLEAPDGKALFYMKTDQNAKLWRSAVDGSGETDVLNGVDSRGLAVTADRVYYLRQEPNGSFTIRRYVIATRENSQIASLAKPVFGGLSISPDGKYFIYSQRLEASNLMLVEDFH